MIEGGVELCRARSDSEADAIRTALDEAGIRSQVVFGKQEWVVSTPTSIHVERGRVDEASEIARDVMARFEASAPATEPFLSPAQRAVAVLLVPSVFIVAGLASGSLIWLAGVGMVAAYVLIEVGLRRFMARRSP